MADPRDKRFYQLQKKARTSLSNLTLDELKAYLSYAKAMLNYVSDKRTRKSWHDLEVQISEYMKE